MVLGPRFKNFVFCNDIHGRKIWSNLGQIWVKLARNGSFLKFRQNGDTVIYLRCHRIGFVEKIRKFQCAVFERSGENLCFWAFWCKKWAKKGPFRLFGENAMPNRAVVHLRANKPLSKRFVWIPLALFLHCSYFRPMLHYVTLCYTMLHLRFSVILRTTHGFISEEAQPTGVFPGYASYCGEIFWFMYFCTNSGLCYAMLHWNRN